LVQSGTVLVYWVYSPAAMGFLERGFILEHGFLEHGFNGLDTDYSPAAMGFDRTRITPDWVRIFPSFTIQKGAALGATPLRGDVFHPKPPGVHCEFGAPVRSLSALLPTQNHALPVFLHSYAYANP
jgi:hypothetical protein